MKLLIISTTVYNLPPPGYSGLEALCYFWACEFAKQGHQVSVVAPGDSQFPAELNIQLISTGLREPEEAAYLKYKNSLESNEFDCCLDSSWGWFSVLSQQEASKQLPVVHIYHSDFANLGSPPPIQYPCIVALSNDQAEGIGKKWGVGVRRVYNGIDLSFYKADPEVERGSRYLFMGRYTPEKAPLEAIFLAKKCRVPLDLYGDVEIIASQDYLTKVVNECDNRQIVFHPGVSREETVKLYQSHKALIHLVNYNEAFGLVPVECMACGTPVIVNRRGALPELVKNGRSGFVVGSLEEAEELIKSDAVCKLKTEDIVKQGKKFSIEASAKGHLRLLSDVANKIYW